MFMIPVSPKFTIIIAMMALVLSLSTDALATDNTTMPPTAAPVPTATSEPTQENTPTADSAEPQPLPFGANLFDSKANSGGSAGINPNYSIAIGDKIQLKIWGALQSDQVTTVDPQGNIFIPEVGPIQVAGASAGSLQGIVEGAIRQVFFDNVEVYASVLSANTISVYVSGAVMHPGQYSGLSSDSVLAFMQKAGGINNTQGSYRRIDIIQNRTVIDSVDLYAFLVNGSISTHRFQEGDTILVHPIGDTVTVTGASRNPFQFEFTNSPSGQEIIRYAQPRNSVTHVAIKGTRPDGLFSTYVPYQDFLKYRFSDGDSIRFEADLQMQDITVTIEGSHQGPSFYAVRKDSTLQEILDYIPIDVNDADIKSVYLKRKSVMARQQKLLDDSLRRLEQSVLTAPASSDGEATIRTEEAGLVTQFVQRAKSIKPEGRVVVSESGTAANIRMEDGDIIVIPRKTDVVNVGGEILLPQAIVYMKNARIGDYLAKAGGLTERGDPSRVLIIHANGAADMNASATILAGDEILVLPKVDTKNMQFTKDITQIIYQIAVAAKVAAGL